MSGSLGVRSGLQGAVSRWSRMPREDRATCHTNYLPGEILYIRTVPQLLQVPAFVEANQVRLLHRVAPMVG